MTPRAGGDESASRVGRVAGLSDICNATEARDRSSMHRMAALPFALMFDPGNKRSLAVILPRGQVEALLQLGADVHGGFELGPHHASHGPSPAHYAAARGQEASIRALAAGGGSFQVVAASWRGI